MVLERARDKEEREDMRAGTLNKGQTNCAIMTRKTISIVYEVKTVDPHM